MYIFDYPKKYLYSYPEFYVEKTYGVLQLNTIPLSIKNIIKIRENSSNKTNTFSVYNFFKLQEVTNKNILHTGW